MRAFLQKYGMYLLLALCILLRVEHRYHFRNFYLDTQLQIAAAANLLQGHGLSLAEADPANPTRIQYRPLHGFTPLYSLLLIPFYLLLHDWLWAAWALDVIAIVIFFLATHQWFRYVFGPRQKQAYAIYLLFMAVSPAPFHYLTSSGLLAWAFFAWGMYMVLRCMHQPQEQAYWQLLLLAACMWLTVGMRYAYLGVAVLPPFLLAMCAYLRKQRIYWKLAAQTALLLYPLLGGLMAFQAWQQGKANYLAEVSKGFFPEHLLAMDAFPLKTFFYYGFIHQQALLKEYPLVGKLFVAAACLFSLVLIIIIIYYAVIWNRPAYRQHAAGAWLLASCVVIGANVLMLAYLSLRVPPEQWGDLAFWTYVMESRYYAPAMLMILLSCYLLAFYGEMKHAEISGLRRGMRYFIYGTLLIAGAYFMLLRYQLYVQHAGPATFAHQDVKTLYARLKNIKQEEKPLVFVADPPMRLGEWVGAASLAAEELAKLDSLQFSRQWCLLLYTRKPDSGLVRSLGRAGRHVQKDSLQQGVLLHLCFP